MIDYRVGRAQQIAQLEPWELDSLHIVEKERGYCIPNWNIQELFKKSSLNEALGVPESSWASHNKRIKEELEKKVEMSYLNELRVNEVHHFDNEVTAVKGTIIWDYTGKSRLGALKKKLMGANVLFLF